MENKNQRLANELIDERNNMRKENKKLADKVQRLATELQLEQQNNKTVKALATEVLYFLKVFFSKFHS